MELAFAGRLVEWRGPAPYFYVVVPAEVSDDVRRLAAGISYGWGVVPVEARIGEVTFTTSLFPKDGGYLLPLRDAVRTPLHLAVDDEVDVAMRLGRRR